MNCVEFVRTLQTEDFPFSATKCFDLFDYFKSVPTSEADKAVDFLVAARFILPKQGSDLKKHIRKLT